MSASAPANKSVDLVKLVEKLNELPTLPTIVYELTRIINNPMSSIKQIEAVMERDQSITTKVLKLVNSAYYAVPGGVSNLSRAIAFLGFDTINQLVLSTTIIKTLQSQGATNFNVQLFWQHALGVGMAAESIGSFIKHRQNADLFICGLIHDIGKLALYMVAPDLLLKIIELSQIENLSFYEAELKLEIPTHMHLGSLLIKKWKLPQSIQSAVLFHHQVDPLRRQGTPAEQSRNIDIILLANLMIHLFNFGHSGHNKIDEIPKTLMDRLGIPEDQTQALKDKILKSLSESESFLKIIQGTK